MLSNPKTLAALLPVLFAASTSLRANDVLPTVVVTGSRFASAGTDAPIATQVITADDIRDSSALTVSEVLTKLGGVASRINMTGVPESPLDLRGFGMTGEQNTLVLINGQRVSENEGVVARISAIPVNAIERIEIVRGSGAVLYGGGATSGVINIITRSAVQAGTSGSVSLLAGSHALRQARADMQTGDGQWGLRLNAQRYETDNYRRNNRATQDALSGQLRLGQGDDFVSLSFNADEQKARLPGARTEAELKSDPRGTSTPDDYINSRSTQFALRGEKRLADLTVAMDIGHRRKAARSLNWGSSLMRTEVDVTTVSPRLLWSARRDGLSNQLTVGADWSDWSYQNDSIAPWQSQDESSSQRNRALYVRDELQLPATGTRLSLGWRREEVRQTQADRLLPRPASSARHHLSAHELSVQQTLSEPLMAYARLGRSFRVGNVDENRCWASPCLALLRPQRSQDRELGLQWDDRQGTQARLGVFEMRVDDEIHYNILTSTNMNLDPTRRRGLELEGKVTLARVLDLTARYTRTQARFRTGSYGGVDVSGKEVPLVAEDRFGLNLGWQATDRTRASLNVQHVGSQRYDNDQANVFRKMPSYTVADVKLSHDVGAWSLSGGINNLLDKKYYSYAIVNSSYTSFNAYPEARRTAYLSGEYRF